MRRPDHAPSHFGCFARAGMTRPIADRVVKMIASYPLAGIVVTPVPRRCKWRPLRPTAAADGPCCVAAAFACHVSMLQMLCSTIRLLTLINVCVVRVADFANSLAVPSSRARWQTLGTPACCILQQSASCRRRSGLRRVRDEEPSRSGFHTVPPPGPWCCTERTPYLSNDLVRVPDELSVADHLPYPGAPGKP